MARGLARLPQVEVIDASLFGDAVRLLDAERPDLIVSDLDLPDGSGVEILNVLDRTLALPNVQLRPAMPAGMHPTRSAEVVIAGKVRGHVGEVDPAVCEAYGVSGRAAWIELDLGSILDGPHGNRRYSPISKFPSSDLDLAFEVPDELSAANVLGALRKGGGKHLVDAQLFDTYRGTGVAEGARSLAFRLRFQAADHTLNDTELAELRDSCIAAAQTQKGVTLRG